MHTPTEGQIIAGLITALLALVGTIVRMAFHIRDLNKTLTKLAIEHGNQSTAQAEATAKVAATQANKHSKEMNELQEAWREESNERADQHAKLLLHTNRVLDAHYRSKRAGNDPDSKKSKD